jgi:hypothetical protein
MKRFMFAMFVLMTVCAGTLFAQQVKTALGDFTLNGTYVTGAVLEMKDQEGGANSGVWGDIAARNPDWTENRFELVLSYAFGNYGASVSLKTPGPINDFFFGNIDVGHAFVYVDLLDNKIRASMGKLYNQLIFWPGTEIWKTRLTGNNFSFSGEGNIALRMEFKPIDGLNFGFQYFFVEPNGDKAGIADTESWKEFGLGAEYEAPEKFSVQAGIRFDSNVDGKNWIESSTVPSYLDEYYGPMGYSSAALGSVPMFGLFSNYKYIDELYDWGADPYNNPAGIKLLSFDGGAYTFFGFTVNAIKDLPIGGRAGFFNIGAFDKWGFAYMLETISYNGIKDLSLNFSMVQQFYGKDEFKDGIVNAPLLTFDPEVTYKLPVNNLSATLTGSFGLCPDVLNYQYSIKPKLSYALGIGLGSVELYYNFEHKDFVDAVNIKDVSYHKIGLAVWWMF